MNAFLRTCLFCWGVLCGWAVQAAEPAVAVYYGNKASLSELSLYDIAVVEPGHGYDPVQFRKQAPGSELYAYASVAEEENTRLRTPAVRMACSRATVPPTLCS